MRFFRMTGPAALATVALVGAASWAGAPLTVAEGAPVPQAAAGHYQAAALPTKNDPGVLNCGFTPIKVKPKTLIITCADGNTLADDLVWSKWGSSGAAAKGIITWNKCVPNCAASKAWGKSSATYTLSDLVHTTQHGWLLEELTVHITGSQTGGMKRTMQFPQKPNS